MSSMLSAQGAVLATAMAVSGTVILLAFRLQKCLPPATQFSFDQIPQSSSQKVLRSCISSEGKKREKKKKKVHFAEDVVDPRGDATEFRRLVKSKSSGTVIVTNSSSSSCLNSSPKLKKSGGGVKARGMPANRVALYNGILRDRVVHRVPYSC